MRNELPNGFILKLKETCALGQKNKLISTHKTADDAEAKAKSLGYDLKVFQILDLYNNRVLTARV
ncbi:MAG: hypothetical protein EBU46_11315 [Nitrosomonadaceae bacterium]|nr:hypothetical protein [Nitrosomonadaceae bacterium]